VNRSRKEVVEGVFAKPESQKASDAEKLFVNVRSYLGYLKHVDSYILSEKSKKKKKRLLMSLWVS